MPIRPENKDKYPHNWESYYRPLILEREGHKCKKCGLPNAALCQKCHINHDSDQHKKNRKKNLALKKRCNQTLDMIG